MRYSAQELALLEGCYSRGIRWLAKQLPHRSYASVAKKTSRMGLGRMNRAWSEEEERLMAYCVMKGMTPRFMKKRLARIGSRRTYCAVQSRARDLKRQLFYRSSKNRS